MTLPVTSTSSWIRVIVIWLFLSTAQSCRKIYTMQFGDRCSDLLPALGLSREAFLALNNRVDCYHFKAGQRACVESSASTCSRMYEVKKGDSCQSIIAAAKISQSKFLYINPGINCSNLQVGDQVCIASCRKHYHQRKLLSPLDLNSSNSLKGRNNGRKILLDYIGGTGLPIQFKEVPILSNTIEVYFVLAFAIDANRLGAVQDGNFSNYWISALTPSSICALKAHHCNVRVLLSLSGYSQYISATGATRIIEWYDPKNTTTWINNAFRSISSSVKAYHLDGIDIDYETFPQSKTFVFCIGTLIQKLKRAKIIDKATIAPYNQTYSLYEQLYNQYGHCIDYVNYQFYADDLQKVSDYVDLYNRIAKVFPRRKLLSSIEVMGRGLQGNDFFSALKILKREIGGVPGMFLWTADRSKENGFLVEKVAQCLL
ncbi:hypothetical protein O6H91_11G059300 [Diphasiastrum complanatum]|uniref:Uncharacterized protein n=1 Tax=Diphasiastrum complanatum TaxID=34168 RepID=A0ACC2C9L0_DIPCM|nr:hypothetical protein O6H91_11G059300 [Diphasiastrum complanatum]